MTPSADGGQGGGRRPDHVPFGEEVLNETIRDEIRQKQARRSLHARRFNDGRISGREPVPTYTNPVLDWAMENGG